MVPFPTVTRCPNDSSTAFQTSDERSICTSRNESGGCGKLMENSIGSRNCSVLPNSGSKRFSAAPIFTTRALVRVGVHLNPRKLGGRYLGRWACHGCPLLLVGAWQQRRRLDLDHGSGSAEPHSKGMPPGSGVWRF
jgi:hypothetical protein